MKCFVLSPINSQLVCENKTFNLNKNPQLFTFCGDYFYINNGEKFEQSYFSTDRNFCKNMEIIDLYGDFLCYPKLKPVKNFGYFEVIKKTFTFFNYEFIFSVFVDGNIKLNIKTSYEEKTISLPFKPKDIFASLARDNLILIDLVDKLHFVILVDTLTLNVVFYDTCNDFTLTNLLSLKKVYNGIYTTEKTFHFKYDNGVILDHVSYQSKSNYKTLPKELFLMAFLEKLRLSVDYHHFLSDELNKNKDEILNFFGQFYFAIPPFLAQYKDTYALISKKARYVKFEILNDKICDIDISNTY